MPPEGVEKPPATPGNPRVNPRLKQAGAEVGIDFTGKCDRYPNTVPAHTLLEYAKTVDPELQNNLAEVIFQAYFTDGVVPHGEELVQLGVKVGIAEEQARSIINDKAKLAEAEERALGWSRQGVTGVPYFMFNGRGAFSGAQDSSVIRHTIETVNQKYPLSKGSL